jgi:hypothetical protein
MGIFGWSYPPGCSGPPDDDYPCEVCGQFVDDCICPECPECGSFGDPLCYQKHGLEFSRYQRISLEYCALIELEDIEVMKNYWGEEY